MQQVKIKHLGMFSTGKFLSVFNFILGFVLFGLTILATIVFALFSVLLGLGSGDYNVLAAALAGGVFGVLSTIAMAFVTIILYMIVGFFVGCIVAFVFNMVVKISGGLTFDAEVD